MKRIRYRVDSVKDYRGGAEDVIKTYVRVTQLLYDGPAYAEMDSTVYEIDDFRDIHEIYKNNQSTTLEYDHQVYGMYLKKLYAEIALLK